MKTRNLVLIAVAATGLAAGHAAETSDVRAGMTASEVRQRVGPPVRVSRQILHRRHIEQWVYENPRAFRVQISCNRGDDPAVTRVIPSRNGSSGGKN